MVFIYEHHALLLSFRSRSPALYVNSVGKLGQ
jgi:hypothetical protein